MCDCLFSAVYREKQNGPRWRLRTVGSRCPRPPAVFVGPSMVLTTKPKSIPPMGRWRHKRPKVTPEEVWESAKKRVCGLEARSSSDFIEGFSGKSEPKCLKEPSLSLQLKGAWQAKCTRFLKVKGERTGGRHGAAGSFE